MRIVVIILACIGGFALLTIGGCVGCAALVASAVASMSSYDVDERVLNERYGMHLTAIDNWLSTDPRPARPELPQAFQAIFRQAEDEIGFGEGEELLGRTNGLDSSTYSMWNGTGYAEVREPGQASFMVALREIEVGEVDYIVIIRDPDLLIKREKDE